MRRSATPLLLTVLALAAALGAGMPARAGDGDDTEFRRAELRERALGDLEGAAEMYLAVAARATDAETRARAEIRAASCLRRLGRAVRARALLEPWADPSAAVDPALVRAAARELALLDGPPPPGAGVDVGTGTGDVTDTDRLEAAEVELEQTRLGLERALERAEGYENELEDLANRLQDKDREIARLREGLPPPSPSSAEGVLRSRREEMERERRKAQAVAGAYAGFARVLHHEGRFADARAFLYAAVEKDPENADARALLERVSAPLGDRERLFRQVIETLAMAREVRTSRLAAEARDLLHEGRRRQTREDYQGSVAPLERALVILTDGTGDPRLPAGLLREAEELLTAAVAAGAVREPEATRPGPLTPAAAFRPEWETALRGLLAEAGTEVSQGLRLRFHDLDTTLGTAAGSLPPVPVGERPYAWTLFGDRVEAAPLLGAYLRGAERQILAPGGGDRVSGALLRVEGGMAVVLAEQGTQDRVADRLAALGLSPSSAVDVRVSAHGAAPGDVAALLGRRGVEVEQFEAPGTLHPGASRARLPDGDLAALLDWLGTQGAPRADGTFRARPLRGFRLGTGTVAASVVLDVLPVGEPSQGVAVRGRIRWRPTGRTDGADLSRTVTAGTPLPPGAALVIFGLPDPADPARDLVLVLQVGSAPVREAPAPLPSGPAAGDPASPTAGPASAAEHLLPRRLASIEERSPVSLELPDAPLPGRDDALLARFRAGAAGASLVEIGSGRVLVVGPPEAHAGVRSLLDDLARVPLLQTFEVRMYEVTAPDERRVEQAVPGWTQLENSAFAWAVVSDAKVRRSLAGLLGDQGRELVLAEPRPSVPPTVRADVARMVRSLVLKEVDTVASPGPGWGRVERAWVDEGVVVALRPFGRTTAGRVPLDLSVRTARLRDAVPAARSTPLGVVPLVATEPATLAGDLATSLGPGESLVLAALGNPFGRGTDRTHLVVEIRLAP